MADRSARAAREDAEQFLNCFGTERGFKAITSQIITHISRLAKRLDAHRKHLRKAPIQCSTTGEFPDWDHMDPRPGEATKPCRCPACAWYMAAAEL